jgi:hypothetical protein
MKKLVLILFAGISFATANAQFQFGVKAGANFTTLSDDQGNSDRTQFNFNAGVFAKMPIARFVSFQPELVYSGQGSRYDDGAGGIGAQHLNYFNIPLLFKFAHRSGFFFETGPQVGFLLSATQKDQGFNLDLKPYTNSADFSWVFGFGFKIPESPVGIDFRYNVGISNINNNSVPGNNGTIRNDVLQIGLTYVLFSTSRR